MTQEFSRRAQMKKKKRANLLINSLLAVVGILIIITLANLLSSNDDTAVEADPGDEQQQVTDEGQQDVESEDIAGAETTDEAESTEETEATEEDQTDTTEEQAEVTTEPSTDPIVDEVIVNTAWQPVGTTQTGEHVSSYTKGTVDWDEKIKALQYASGLSADNMYTIFLGNGGSPQKSIGTVTSKDKSEMYRIYLEWVDGQGWKPTKLEKLNQLP
ncbi:YrrS family protein [Chryseomicrobium palamuruense]